MSQTGWEGEEEEEEEGERREKRRCLPASLLAWWTRRSQGSQSAASSAQQNTAASSFPHTSHCTFIPCSDSFTSWKEEDLQVGRWELKGKWWRRNQGRKWGCGEESSGVE